MTIAELNSLLERSLSKLARKDYIASLGYENAELLANQVEIVEKITFLEAQNARLEWEVEGLLKKESQNNLIVHLPSSDLKTSLAKAKEV